MNRTTASTLALALTLILTWSSTARAQCPDRFDWASATVKIKGKHYDASGTETKVKCDTKLGDQIMFVSCFTCSTPPTREIDVWAVSPQCQQLDRVHVTIGPPYHGPGYVWARAETRVVKNGTPKNECLFHGTFLVGGSGYTILSPYLQTIKTFDAAGVARSEKGVFNFSTDDGRMFIGKIKVTWPQ